MSNILVVDDNPASAKLIAYLMRLSGHDVRTARDAAEALAAVRLCPPDLIVMDLELPDMDGCSLTQLLREDVATQYVSIVAVTAFSQSERGECAVRAGCDRFVTKPIDTREFPALVTAQLRRRAAGT